MAVKRKTLQKIKRKKIERTVLGLFIIALVVGVFMFFTKGSQVATEESLPYLIDKDYVSNTELFVFTGKQILNPRGLFGLNFVDVDNVQTNFYFETYDNPKVYHHVPFSDVEAGGQCKTGEVIRFKFCSSNSKKGSCIADIFDQLWQVHYKGNYLNWQDFGSDNYPINSLDFYYSYTCYEPLQIFPDTFERKYLYNGECLNFEESGGNGVDYGTERYCLEAKQGELTQETRDVSSSSSSQSDEQVFDDERRICEDNGGQWNSDSLSCKYGQENSELCEENGGAWDYSRSRCEYQVTPQDQIVSDRDDESTITSLVADEELDDTTPVKESFCRAYEEQVGTFNCDFSFKNLLSNQGISDYFEDNTPQVLVVFFMLVIMVIYIGGRRK